MPDDDDDVNDNPGEDVEKPGGYDVGYGKPPLHSRFQKGQSGNPAGRKRKANVDPFQTRLDPITDILREELMRPVTIKEGDKTVKISAIAAVTRAQVFSAVKGGSMAQRDVIRMGRLVETERKERLAADMKSVWSYKERYGQIFEKARRDGRPKSNPLPDPRHIDLDPVTFEIVITGPMVPAEHHAWQHQKQKLREYENAYLQAVQQAKAQPRSKNRKLAAEKLRSLFSAEKRRVPPGWNWREDDDPDVSLE